MHSRIRHTRFAVSALALAIAAPHVAYAALEEVIVTARKTDESIQDVPAAISAFSTEDLQKLNVTQTQDIARFTPSVYIEQPGGNSGTVAKVTIRGQSQSDNIITLDPSVGWYLDDVYLARTQGTATSMFDVERVEVLKGPQGTLYGRNTTGGTIKLSTTKADTSGVSGFVIGGVGNYEQSKIGGAINLPIIDNMLAVRLTALQDKVDEGFQDVTLYQQDPLASNRGQVIGRTKNGTLDNELYRVGITFEPREDLRILGFYEHNESDVTMANGNISPNPGPTVSTVLPNAPLLTGVLGPLAPLAGGWPYVPNSKDIKDVHLNNPNTAASETDTASLTVEYDINDDLTTKLVYGYRHTWTEFDTDIDGTNQAFNAFQKPFVQTAYQNSVEWQLNGNAMEGRLDWVTGLYYFEEVGEDQSFSGGLSATPASIYYQLSKTLVDKNRSRSAFFQGTLHLTDDLSFTGGVRYTRDNKPVLATARSVRFNPATLQLAPALDSCRFAAGSGVPNPQPLPDCTWSSADRFEFVSWTAGFDYKINADVMTYAKASSSSRAGGQNTRGLDAATTQPFDPETATDIEIGAKGQFFDRTLQVNAAYFHTFYSDVQQTNLLSTPSGLVTSVVNQAEGDIDGIEVEAKWAATDYLTLSGSIGWLDWRFDDARSILPSAPTETATLRADYVLPTGAGDMLFNLNWSYRSEFFGNCASGMDCVRNFESETADSLSLFSGRIGLDVAAVEGLNVSLWANNLTDEEYVTPALQLYFPPNVTISNGIAGNPRTYGVEASYRF